MKTADDQARSPLEDVPSLENAQRPSRRNAPRRFCLGAVVGAILLAVALGAGLGAGLKKKSGNAHPSLASTSSLSPNGSDRNVQVPPASNFILRGQQVLAQEPATTRYYDFVLEQRNGAPDGFNKTMLVVNGMYPGPTIEVNSDDRIVVNVTNLMPNATAIHWHGLYQRGTPYYDGTNGVTQCGIPPGSSLVYNFTLDGWVGSTWWHAHMSTQYTDGLSGAFIVHNRTEKLVAEVDGELSLQLSDLYHRFSDDLLVQYLSRAGMTGEGLAGVTQGNEPVPDSGTINGVGSWGSFNSSFTNYTLAANSTYRLRLANTGSFAAASFSVDDHPLTVVEADGVLVEPFTVSSLDIDVAQRYSVLLTTNQTVGAYWMRYTVSQDAFTYTQQSGNYDILGVLRYGVDVATMPVSPDPGNSSVLDSLPAFDLGQLIPAAAQNPPAPNQFYTFSLSMQNTANNNWLAFVNSTSWSPLQGQSTLLDDWAATTQGVSTNDSQLVVTVPDADETQVVQVVLDDGDHPFHLHGHKFWIMGQGQGRYQEQALQEQNPMRRDTVVFPAYTWTVLRFVADNPGVWIMHCHLVWHMASGLAMQFATLPQATAELVAAAPSVLQEQCASMRSV
ncbi:hypothetical protein RHOSPDRAFT_17827 [Rhodotorula sp. JG-1b]|nr:hypothetical protein RHOSPDRAFT_17827 [Rhodotorula sp. JG-1b]